MCWESRPPSAPKAAAGRSRGSRGGGGLLAGRVLEREAVAFPEGAGGQLEGFRLPTGRALDLGHPVEVAVGGTFDDQVAEMAAEVRVDVLSGDGQLFEVLVLGLGRFLLFFFLCPLEVE